MERTKKLSIITVCLNNKSGLIKTIKSVLDQSFRDYEYIIIDGGSSDGSVEIIKQFADKLHYWVSKSDSGIYNAMNKGISQANGEYCLFLNSGDTLSCPGILEKCFNIQVSDDIIYCDLIFDNGDGLLHKVFPKELTFYDFFIDSIGHPSSLIKKELFKKIGFFNENLQIVSDWEFFLKAVFIHKCSLYHINEYLSVFDRSGISSKYGDLMQAERLIVLEELFPRFISDYRQLVLLSGYSNLHSGNKHIKQFAGLINQLLAIHRKVKGKRAGSCEFDKEN